MVISLVKRYWSPSASALKRRPNPSNLVSSLIRKEARSGAGESIRCFIKLAI